MSEPKITSQMFESLEEKELALMESHAGKAEAENYRLRMQRDRWKEIAVDAIPYVEHCVRRKIFVPGLIKADIVLAKFDALAREDKPCRE